MDPVSPALPRSFPPPLFASIAAVIFVVALALLGLLVVLALVSIRLERSSRRRRLASLAEVAQHSPSLIVVLGCPPRTRQGQPSRYLQGRISAAAAAFHHLGGVPILCSGRPAPAGGEPKGSEAEAGLVHADDEVAALRRGLEAARVPKPSILEDRDAVRTIDTIDHLARHHASHRLLIVTQPFHLPRALYLARERGLEAWGFTAPGPIPGWRGELREALGRLRAHFDVAFGRRRR